MKNLLAVLLGCLFFFTALEARAGTIGGNDPRVIIGGGMGSLPVGDSFIFISPSGTSPGTSPCVVGTMSEPDCVFQNATETSFSTLTFDIPGPFTAGEEFECGVIMGGPFTTCSIMTNSQAVIATFSGGTGVAPSTDFSIEVDGWGAGQNFGVGANGAAALPEPATVFLLLTGLAGCWIAFRRAPQST